MATEPSNLTDLLDGVAEQATQSSVTVGEVLIAFGRRSHGPILFLPGFLAASPTGAIPGVTLVAGVLVFLVAVQMMFSPGSPWLPKRLTKISLSSEKIIAAIRVSREPARWVDRFMQSRLTFLFEPPFITLGIALCGAMALLMIPFAFVPFAASLPGLAIAVFGLAVTANDGILAIVAGAISAASAALGLYIASGL